MPADHLGRLREAHSSTLREKQKSVSCWRSGIVAAMDEDNGLAVLPGGHLDTVSFVMDYVEFRISYNVLRALASPVVTLADARATGSRKIALAMRCAR